MAYADQIAAIKVHAIAAGAAVVPPILDVDIGAPMPGATRSLRIFYGGEAEPERMDGGLTLNSQMVAERIVIVAWWALSNSSLQEVAAVETEMYALKHELRTRILADAQLGGQATDVVLDYFESDFVVIGNTRYRMLEAELRTEFIEYTIAP